MKIWTRSRGNGFPERFWRTGNGEKRGYERGKDYNHSAYADIVISRIFGVEPQEDGTVRIHPMIPDSWEYCRLSGLNCQGRELSICMDRTGETYGKRGMQIRWED